MIGDTEESVKKVLRRSKYWSKDMETRKMFLYCLDAYGYKDSRTIFFGFEGTPNRFTGYMERCGDVWAVNNKYRKFYYSETNDKVGGSYSSVSR